MKHFGMCYRDLSRQSLVILSFVSMKSSSFLLVLFLRRHNFLERLGKTCNSHDPSEGDVFQRQVILCQIRSGPMFNIEEEACLNITIDLLGNEKKKGGRDTKVVSSKCRSENSEDPHLDFSWFVCFGVWWKNVEVFCANSIKFFLSSFFCTKPFTSRLEEIFECLFFYL